MSKFCVPKRCHFSLPNRSWKSWNKPDVIIWRFVTDPSMEYDLPQRFQEDWNKGGGVSAHFWDRNKNAAMWGWRWRNGKVEVNAYYNHSNAKSYTGPLVELSIGEYVDVVLEFDWENKKYKFTFVREDGSTISHSEKFTHDKTKFWETNFYFGGDGVAPHKVCCYRHRAHRIYYDREDALKYEFF